MKIVLALIVMVALVSCGQKPVKEYSCDPVSFGQNTYYFPCPEVFGESLASFKSARPREKVTAIAPDTEFVDGVVIGYFVSTEVVEP